jgi:hypothetical protein
MTRSEYCANVSLSTRTEANEWARVLGPSKGKVVRKPVQKPGVLVRVIRAVFGR